MNIQKTNFNDLQEILDLQYLAYQSEAKLLNTHDIPPLRQTLEDVKKEYEKGFILKAMDENGVIAGSVRAYSKDGTLYIGKLIVRPDMQGLGMGTKLLGEAERFFPHGRYELFTSSQSIKNIRLYERLGYRIFTKKTIDGGLTFIYLEKHV